LEMRGQSGKGERQSDEVVEKVENRSKASKSIRRPHVIRLESGERRGVVEVDGGGGSTGSTGRATGSSSSTSTSLATAASTTSTASSLASSLTDGSIATRRLRAELDLKEGLGLLLLGGLLLLLQDKGNDVQQNGSWNET
jgi:hypothetical protein